MKLSLSVTQPAPPLGRITGMGEDVSSIEFKPGMMHVIPEPEPMVLVEAEADGMAPDAVAAVLRSAADAVEQIGRHGLLTVGARHKGRYTGALADRRGRSYVGRHMRYATGGYLGVNR